MYYLCIKLPGSEFLVQIVPKILFGETCFVIVRDLDGGYDVLWRHVEILFRYSRFLERRGFKSLSFPHCQVFRTRIGWSGA